MKIRVDRSEIIATLKKYVKTTGGVTGYEDPIKRVIKEDVEEYCDEIREDNIGNLIAIKKGKKDRPLIMLCSHMDEIGYVVKSIDKGGFVWFERLGGVPEGIWKGQWMIIHTDKGNINGAAGATPPHLVTGETGGGGQFIDVGASSKDEAEEMGIRIADPITIDRDFIRLENPEMLMGRCLDNRMGCAALTHTLKILSEMEHNVTVAAVFSSTEESGVVPKGTEVEIHGSKGAYVAARYLKPDFAFVVDSCVSSDIPGIPEKDVMVRLKRGPVLRVIDEYTIMRPAVRKFIMKILEEAGISYQVGFSATYTDASVIQLMDVPVAVVGIPIRYIHFPCQIISSEDLENTVNLLVHSLLTIDSTPDFKKNLEY